MTLEIFHIWDAGNASPDEFWAARVVRSLGVLQIPCTSNLLPAECITCE